MTSDLDGVIEADLPGDAPGELLRRLIGVVGPHHEVSGWATVDLDRAETALVDDPGPPPIATSVSDVLLGAKGRYLEFADGQGTILLEPSTEGRLAAALARHGEGHLATFVLAGPDAERHAREAGLPMTSLGAGPFGPERLVLGGSRWGPFILLISRP